MNNYLKDQLIKYIKLYLKKKNLHMKHIMISIQNRLIKNEPITINQIKSVVKFLERETEFSHMNRSQIINHFKPLTSTIYNPKINSNRSIDLQQFFI